MKTEYCIRLKRNEDTAEEFYMTDTGELIFFTDFESAAQELDRLIEAGEYMQGNVTDTAIYPEGAAAYSRTASCAIF